MKDKCKGCTKKDCPQKQKDKKKKGWKNELKKEMKIIKLMKESQNHDHNKCNCEGCYWWCMTTTVFKNARLFQVVRGWKDLDRDEYLRMIQRVINYKIDKKTSKKKFIKFLKSKGLTPKQAKEAAQKMNRPIFVVMYRRAPSPLGLMRDV